MMRPNALAYLFEMAKTSHAYILDALSFEINLCLCNYYFGGQIVHFKLLQKTFLFLLLT